MEAGGKPPALSSGGRLHHDSELLKSLSSVEPCKFGLGLVAGFLLVTCAYFLSTAEFDVAPIFVSKQHPITPQPYSGTQGQGGVISPAEDTKKDEASAMANGDASVADGEVLEKDDDAGAVAVRPPLSSDPTNSTQESGGLEDEELKVQYAEEAADPAKKRNNISSIDNGSFPTMVPSDIAEVPAAPMPEIDDPSAHPAAPKIEAPAPAPAAQPIPPIPEAEQSDWKAPLREWRPLCDVTSNFRIDWCELDGDVRVLGAGAAAGATVTLVAAPGADERTFREETWSIKPYPRKVDPNAMRNVRAATVRSVAGGGAPACTDRHGVPGLVFSTGGYTGNYFHAFTDVILPLFLTARRFSGEVLLLATDVQPWWVGKYLPVFKGISNYELVDLAGGGDPAARVHCFRHVQVGLTSHDDFSIDPRRAPNNYSMLDFAAFMRAAYGLPRAAVPAATRRRRPRLLVIARARTRRLLNTEEVVRGARRAGFEAVVSEGGHEVAPFAELANGCDAMVGVHGAGLTNMVFLPTGGVVIQVLPLGPLEFVAGYFRRPSGDMGLRYLEYRISPEESTLADRYPAGHRVFTNPGGGEPQSWAEFMGVYLFEQDVRLNMTRFRPVLKKALGHLRKAKNS
ncbi:hypothetical protein ACP4OV_022381 [Aristida adscensionis]